VQNNVVIIIFYRQVGYITHMWKASIHHEP